MINIDIKSTVIPVVIGELTFHFDMSDDAIKKVDEKYKSFSTKLEKYNDDGEKSKELLSEGFAIFLGDGSFDKIFEQTPSTAICIEYLFLVTEKLYGEMIKKIPSLSQSGLLNEYLSMKASR